MFFNKKDRLITIRIIFGLYQSKIDPKLALLMLSVHLGLLNIRMF